MVNISLKLGENQRLQYIPAVANYQVTVRVFLGFCA